MEYTENFLINGGNIWTSGTTGNPKEIHQPLIKIQAANEVACRVQGITNTSSVYTVCNIAHVGGLLAQTLPALSVGAPVVITPFSAYAFVREITQYTHTHLTPDHAKAVMLTKGFQNLDLTGVTITCGSSRVGWDIIEGFVQRGATFITNWGMTEVGPIAINQRFETMADVVFFKNMKVDGSFMGSTAQCGTRVIDNELQVCGDISVYGPKWFRTGDRVSIHQGTYWYHGRI